MRKKETLEKTVSKETSKKEISWFKKAKKFLKKIFYRIIYFFNKKSKLIPEKWKKKFKKKDSEIRYNWYDRLLFKLTGTEDLIFPDEYASKATA